MIDSSMIDLFKSCSSFCESLAERALEKKVEDKEGTTPTESAQSMLDRYKQLSDKLVKAPQELNAFDYISLYIGANLLVSNLKRNLKKIENTIEGYEKLILPRIKELMTGVENFKEKEEELFGENFFKEEELK